MDEREIDFRGLLTIFNRYKWLIILSAIFSTLIVFLISYFLITPTYEASTEILVNTAKNEDGYTYNINDMNTDLKLISTYSVIIKSPRIIDKVIKEYKFDNLNYEDLANRIDVSSVKDSQVMKVTVRDTNQEQAAFLANSIARVFRSEIGSIMNVDNVQILTDAKIIDNGKPIKPNIPLNTFVAFFLGLLLGIGLAMFLHFFDSTFKSEEDIEKVINVPVLATIGTIKPKLKISKNTRKERSFKLFAYTNPKSQISDAFRTLRINLQFINVDTQLKVIMVTSISPQDGKSTTIANLAIVLAQNDKRVLLIDTDLRKPTLHYYFNLSNQIGLTSVLAEIESIENAVNTTTVTKLSVLTSGPIPPNPTELLGSKKMKNIIAELLNQYDFILFDTPPLFSITDPLVISQYTDGVLLVVRYGKTKREMAAKAKVMLTNVKTDIIGVVLNNKAIKDKTDYYYCGK